MRDTPQWQWVEDEASLAELIQTLQEATSVGLDTEFMRERTYRPQLALLQCRTDTRTWLVDTTLEQDFTGLACWLAGGGLKILHSCREDLDVLAQTLAPMSWPVWDTQLAEAFLGGPLQLSYQKLVQAYTGIELEKGETRSNWLQRPLSEAQCRYAAEDVIWLPEIQQQQAQKLDQLGRTDWFEQDMRALLQDGERDMDSTRLHLSFRSALDMDETALRRLRDLLHWREQTAMTRNLPKGFVLKNDVLQSLAFRPPTSMRQLEAMDLHPTFLRKHGDALLQLLQGEGPFALPEQPERPLPPLDQPEDKQALAALRKQVKALAEQFGLEAPLIATRKDMEQYLRWQRGLLPQPGRLGQGWRAALLQRTD